MVNSVKVHREDIRKYDWQASSSPSCSPRVQTKIPYEQVINFERCSSSSRSGRHCVLCGTQEDDYEGFIPKQNKGVCRTCDSCHWLLVKSGVVVKFCKGCKLFFSLKDFDGKPNTTKCGTCRRRGRDNYHGKKIRKRLLNAMHLHPASDSDATTEEDMEIENESGNRAAVLTPTRKKQRINSIPCSSSSNATCHPVYHSSPELSVSTACRRSAHSPVEDKVASILLDMRSDPRSCNSSEVECARPAGVPHFTSLPFEDLPRPVSSFTSSGDVDLAAALLLATLESGGSCQC